MKKTIVSPSAKQRAVVAIPAKVEAKRVAACLSALGAQSDQFGVALHIDKFAVVILANDCSDDTADIARRAARFIRFEVRVEEVTLPPAQAHAGGARRHAMDLADAWLRGIGVDNGVVLSTDADSQVAPDWIAANLDAFAKGADAVLGRISLDAEGELLPAALHARGRLEATYEELLTEISARLDPLDGNPWPHHSTISGASLGVTQQMYRRIGGLPCVPLGEDKALVAALRRNDARIRFAPDVRVITSGRTFGRAPGGVADALRLRSEEPNAKCDEALEPCSVAYMRAFWRGQLRSAGFSNARSWAKELDVPAEGVVWVHAAPTFGSAWGRIEQSSRALARRRLSPRDLPLQIEIARRMLARLMADKDIEAILRAPVRQTDLDEAV